MPTIKRTNSLGANASANPLVGSQYEFLPFPALIEVAIVCSPGAAVIGTMFSGSDVLLEESPIDEKPDTAPIVYPEDYQIQDVAAAGERLGLTIRETAGAVGPGTVRTVVRVTPI